VTNHPRPAWLMVAFGAGLTALLTVAGCARVTSMSSELMMRSTLAARILKKRSEPTPERPAVTGDSVHLTSAVISTTTLASAETPVEELPEAEPTKDPCPPNMVSIEGRFCIDKYEASLVEILPDGEERPFPYFERPAGHNVRAVSEKGVYPQAHISGREAAAACKASGKRLCKPHEWKMACKGPENLKYGYDNKRSPGTCNDNGRSPLGYYHAAAVKNGSAFSSYKIMNDPQLNQLPGTLAETGSHEGCTNGYGVYDMVGNIHEWVDDPAGTFQGGYYLDVEQNGEGCGYRTDAHNFTYHDYSTGFRCCADIE